MTSTIRPYLDKGLTAVPYWMLGELVTILGTSVVESAIAEARAIDGLQEQRAIKVEAEIAINEAIGMRLLNSVGPVVHNYRWWNNSCGLGYWL